MEKLFKQIREKHPAFHDLGSRSEDLVRILRVISTMLDAFNPLRNKASVAHPNADLLPEAEAMFVINIARSILHDLDSKTQGHGSA